MSFAERLRRVAHGDASHTELLEFAEEFRRMTFHVSAEPEDPETSGTGGTRPRVSLIASSHGDLPLLVAGCDPARVAQQLEVSRTTIIELTGEELLAVMATQPFHLCLDPDGTDAANDRSEVLSHEQLQVFDQLEHIRRQPAAPGGVRTRLKGGHRLH